MIENENRLMRPSEVSSILGINTRTLANWRNLNKGPAYIKIDGHTVRYVEADIIEYLNSLEKY